MLGLALLYSKRRRPQLHHAGGLDFFVLNFEQVSAKGKVALNTAR